MFLFLAGLLVLPFRLVVDSHRSKYFIEIPIYFRAQLVPDNQLFFLKLKLFFIPIKIRLDKKRKTKTKLRDTKQFKKAGIATFRMRQLVPKVLKSIKVKRVNADIDTGDFPLNAQLIPVTQFINNRNIHLQINFENRNNVDIEIFIQLYKLVWIGIKNKLLTIKK